MGILDAFQRFDTLTSQYQSGLSASASGSSGRSQFATAVVSRPSTDFIRAANAAQSAAYSISQTNTDKPGELEKAEVKKKLIGLATPLRKGISDVSNANPASRVRKPRKSKVGLVLNPDNDPEVPLRAALKLVDMYPTAVRTGLREEIIEKIQDAQTQSSRITELLKPNQQSRGDEENSGRVRELEEEIRALEAEYARARKKVDDMMKAKAAQQFAEADESIDSEGSPLVQRSARQVDKRRGPPQQDLAAALREADDDATTDFRHLNLSDTSLLIDSATPDISQLMAQTPMKLNSSGAWDRPKHVPLAALAQRTREGGKRTVAPRTPPRRQVEDDSFEETPRAGYTFEAQDLEEDSLDQGEDPTVMIQVAQTENVEIDMSTNEEEAPTLPADEEPVADQSVVGSPIKVEDSMTGDHPPSIYSQRIRSFNMKIWSIAGDVLSPGNNYDVGKGSGTQPAPILRETIMILQSIIDGTESSPSSSQDEPFRVLTAALILYLIKRDSSAVDNPDDAFSSGMNEAKAILSTTAEAHGWRKEVANKVPITWIGKKLLKGEGGRKLRCNLD